MTTLLRTLDTTIYTTLKFNDPIAHCTAFKGVLYSSYVCNISPRYDDNVAVRA